VFVVVAADEEREGWCIEAPFLHIIIGAVLTGYWKEVVAASAK
jgi:hypothetical protein